MNTKPITKITTIKKSNILKLIGLAIIIIVAIAVALNWTFFRDFYLSKTYQPTSEMAAIRDSLNLTGKGELIFNASHPELNTEDDFNINCQSFDDEEAILGCYTELSIYIYNITESRLQGIRELTAAHELLHAVYERMSPAEKDSYREALEQTYRDNQDILKEEIEAYDSAEQLEEIYVRSGTEIKDLPASLEKHFAEIFKNQDKIVDFYNGYIKVFRQIENELDALKSEMDSLNATIEAKTAEYESRVDSLNSEIDAFNNCADTAGCFASEYAFYARRNQLVAEQNSLNVLYDEIDHLIDDYNTKVEKYNANVLESNNLQNIINSHIKVEGL